MGNGKHLWQILITTLQILLISCSTALLTGSMQESIILAHFHLHSPISISPETLQFSDFFFSLLKSHCWFLILKTAYNNVAKRGDSEARKYKRSILASAVIRGWPTEYSFILVILTFHIEKLSISASEIKYWMLKMQRDAKFPFNHVGSPFKPNH